MDLVGDHMMTRCETWCDKVNEIYACAISIMIEPSDTSPEVQVTTTWWVKNHVMVYRVMRIMTCRAIEGMRVGSPAYHN